MPLVTDPNDPRLGRGPGDETPVPQNAAYLVLSAEELAKGYLQPVRRTYVHKACGAETTMPLAIAQTYARDPWFYGATYCCSCGKHRPLQEFTWDGAQAEMSPLLWDEDTSVAVQTRKEALRG